MPSRQASNLFTERASNLAIDRCQWLAQAATFYGRIFDPQVFHERTGVQRYYVRLGAAYIAFGPQANVTPYIDHIAAGAVDFVEADFGTPEVKAEITAAGLTAPPGVLPMLPDPDQLRLQLVNPP